MFSLRPDEVQQLAGWKLVYNTNQSSVKRINCLLIPQHNEKSTQLYPCSANTTPSSLFAKATNLIVIGTTKIQVQVSSVFPLRYLYSVHSFYFVTHCNSVAYFLCRCLEDSWTVGQPPNEQVLLTGICISNKPVLPFLIIAIFPFSLFILTFYNFGLFIILNYMIDIYKQLLPTNI